MWRVLVIVGIVFVTSIALYEHASLTTHGAPTHLFGYPVTNAGTHETAWIAMAGNGGIVLFGGIGLVTIGWFGIGALFAVGQVSAGGIAIGQAAFGLSFVCAQLGLGVAGYTQLGAGGYMSAQAALAADGAEMLGALHAWLTSVLRLSRPNA